MTQTGRAQLETWKRRAEICVRNGMVSPVSAEDTLRLIAALEEALARLALEMRESGSGYGTPDIEAAQDEVLGKLTAGEV